VARGIGIDEGSYSRILNHSTASTTGADDGSRREPTHAKLRTAPNLATRRSSPSSVVSGPLIAALYALRQCLMDGPIADWRVDFPNGGALVLSAALFTRCPWFEVLAAETQDPQIS